MIVRVFNTNGANIHAKRFDDVATEDLGFTEEQWLALDDEKKQQAANDYVAEQGWIETWFEENPTTKA